MLTLRQPCYYGQKTGLLPEINSHRHHGRSYASVYIFHALSKHCPMDWFYFSNANKKKKKHELQTFKASRNNNFLVQPIEHDARKQRERWKAAAGEGWAAKFSHLQTKTNTGLCNTMLFFMCTRQFCICRWINRGACSWPTSAFSWETHKQGCSGRGASFQRELDSVIPPAELLQTRSPRFPAPILPRRCCVITLLSSS